MADETATITDIDRFGGYIVVRFEGKKYYRAIRYTKRGAIFVIINGRKIRTKFKIRNGKKVFE